MEAMLVAMRRSGLQLGCSVLTLALAGCHADVAAASTAIDPDETTIATPTADQEPVTTSAATGSPVAPIDYFGGITVRPEIPTPEEALGYSIGEHFTRQAEMLPYLETIAALSDRVQLHTYGQTNQRRPLVYMVISAPSNLARLPEILERNRALTDPATDDATVASTIENNPAIAWFSYNVHGNEPSCTEAAIALAYTLAAGTNPEIDTMLDDVVLVVDPLLNPDGRERYVAWYQNALGMTPLPHPNAAEHYEPWPGGRSNHYMFDLNRDWCWLTQVESQQRLPIYRQFLPQLHIDHHEQGYRSPFFFGEGDTPYNLNIPKATKDGIRGYGFANAEAFDANGLEYSTRERFDYLYPGYGKVLPVYHGAIGMLAEKGGHSRAGLAIRVNDAYTLTLRNRAAHHWLLGMSNLDHTAKTRRAQLERFRTFFTDSAKGEFTDTSAFVIRSGGDSYRRLQLLKLCYSHGIQVDIVEGPTSLAGQHDILTGEPVERDFLPSSSLIIRTNQPMGRLVNALFERAPELEDRDTYDITSWSALIAFGLDATYVVGPCDVETRRLTPREHTIKGMVSGSPKRSALIVDARQHFFPHAIGIAQEEGIFGRIASDDFTIDDINFVRGSFILRPSRNDPDAMDRFIERMTDAGVHGIWVSRALTEAGPVLGADSNRVLDAPRVMLLKDDRISSLSYGQTWHLFDVAAKIPHTPVTARGLREIDLSDFNVLVVPSGTSLNVVLERSEDAINDWVRGGGVVVAIGAATSWANNTLLEVEDARAAGEDNGLDDVEADPEAFRMSYEERDKRSVNERIPGAMLRVDLDMTHPLTAGMSPSIGVIKNGRRELPVGENGYVIAQFADAPYIGGAISEENVATIAGSPMMTLHRMGRGSVICLVEDPTMRGFQYEPMRLLLNAVIYGPTL